MAYQWPWLSFEIDGVNMSQFVAVRSVSAANATSGRNSASYKLYQKSSETPIAEELEHPDVWTDSFTIEILPETEAARRLFFTTYFVAGLPTITIDGVPQLVCAISEVEDTPGWKFYYIPGAPGISHNQEEPLLEEGLLEITYPVAVPVIGGVSASPRFGQASTVTIKHYPTDTVLFSGVVDATETEVLNGMGGFFVTDVRAVGYGVLLDRRVVGEVFKAADYGTVESIVAELVSRYFASMGITFTPVTSTPVGTMVFNWDKGGDAMRKVCDAGGVDFYIDHDLSLKIVAGSAGYGEAPFSIVTDNGMFTRFVRADVNARFWNSVVVRTTRNVAAVREDAFTGDGSTTVFGAGAAFAMLDDVGLDVMIDDAVVSDTDYTVDRDGITFDVAPANGAEIRVSSAPDIDAVARKRDEASIAAFGLVEHLREVRDIPDGETLESYAAAVLQEGLDASPDCTIYTDEPGLEPGQAIAINTGGVNETQLIQQVDMSDGDKGYPRWVVKTSGRPKRIPTVNEVLSRLQSSKNGLDRIANRIRFRLAETYPPDTNPGVEVGVPQQAYAVAEYSGLARRAGINFPAGTGPVKVDVLKNGVSIFQMGGITWLGSGACYTSLFSAWPLPITIGDEFTLDVITGDATAHDGYLWVEYM